MRERDNRLYELRCSRKLSQGVVGDMLNLSQTRVSAYERGGSIPSEILEPVHINAQRPSCGGFSA